MCVDTSARLLCSRYTLLVVNPAPNPPSAAAGTNEGAGKAVRRFAASAADAHHDGRAHAQQRRIAPAASFRASWARSSPARSRSPGTFREALAGPVGEWPREIQPPIDSGKFQCSPRALARNPAVRLVCSNARSHG